MAVRTTLRRRRRLSSQQRTIESIDLNLSTEEIMADLDPGWLVWRDRPEEERTDYSTAA